GPSRLAPYRQWPALIYAILGFAERNAESENWTDLRLAQEPSLEHLVHLTAIFVPICIINPNSGRLVLGRERELILVADLTKCQLVRRTVRKVVREAGLCFWRGEVFERLHCRLLMRCALWHHPICIRVEPFAPGEPDRGALGGTHRASVPQ